MKKIITALVAVLLLAGCSNSSSAINLDANGFANKVAETGVVTIDVRTPGEFMVGHIQGAINIDVEGMQFDSEIAKLDKAKFYAVYCHSGRRSGLAVAAMNKAGFKNIFNLTNGITDWQNQGLPLVTN